MFLFEKKKMLTIVQICKYFFRFLFLFKYKQHIYTLNLIGLKIVKKEITLYHFVFMKREKQRTTKHKNITIITTAKENIKIKANILSCIFHPQQQFTWQDTVLKKRVFFGFIYILWIIFWKLFTVLRVFKSKNKWKQMDF